MPLAVRPVIDLLDELGVDYYVGGSVAISVHGVSRSTVDIDLMCDISNGQADALIARLGEEYYVSKAAVVAAIERKSCFNLIHYATTYKIDIFVSANEPFDIQCLKRATRQTLFQSPIVIAPLLSVEDSLIRKLMWFRLSDETSERQWDDVTRLLQLQFKEIDNSYLAAAAELVGVTDLLDRLKNL